MKQFNAQPHSVSFSRLILIKLPFILIHFSSLLCFSYLHKSSSLLFLILLPLYLPDFVSVGRTPFKYCQSTSPSAIVDYSDDQPCDLRLLTPTTCLRELPQTQPVGRNRLSIPFLLSPDLSVVKTEVSHPDDSTQNSKKPFAADTALSDDKLRRSPDGGGGKTRSDSGNSGGSSTAPTGGIYMCKQCGNSYARPHSLNRHIRFECGVEPKFECPICHKKSKHKHNLVLHMRTHQQR